MKKSLIVMLSALLLSCSLFAIPASAYQTGWSKYSTMNGKTYWYYTYSDGSEASQGWKYIDENWYYFIPESEGYITFIGLLHDNSGYDYYLKDDCSMAHDEWVHTYENSAVLYYAESDGHINYDKETYDDTINKSTWN